MRGNFGKDSHHPQFPPLPLLSSSSISMTPDIVCIILLLFKSVGGELFTVVRVLYELDVFDLVIAISYPFWDLFVDASLSLTVTTMRLLWVVYLSFCFDHFLMSSSFSSRMSSPPFSKDLDSKRCLSFNWPISSSSSKLYWAMLLDLHTVLLDYGHGKLIFFFVFHWWARWPIFCSAVGFAGGRWYRVHGTWIAARCLFILTKF